MELDAKDRTLINRLQEGLPLVEQPWQEIANELGMMPEEVLLRLGRLKQEGMIRRLGGVFNPSRLGYSGRLYALEVKEELFYATAEVVNSNKGVTHNYRRRCRLNMWFTLSTRTEEERIGILSSIQEAAGGIHIYEFPAEKLFKLKVFMNMEKERGTERNDRRYGPEDHS
ncbi:DNA-binding Lrp family transcriptional regulator [Fontibacillus solani]|uniref:siroheme decarboxylase n=1 Tax=Fontibacillus solani TaxID=1572857 RepID=A0A7W3SS47_9BACL|nr:AsnC family transcriptional regulator [Fontibacillus solani]MBA9085132.1 DNA-binding Lrp family transcriptional regulator [Fontibacillus solani]